MREAMAAADVGDDVYGEDPTVNRLQERVAELLGKETALLVPSGSMANQISIKIHTQPGDEVLGGQGAHSYLFESGGAGAIAGVQITLLPGDGRFDANAVRTAFKPDNHHFPPTRLVTVENTHNMGGGVVWKQDEVRAVCSAARELGLAAHLDGARLWNAAAATGLPLAELAAPFDTVSVCLSKGLGAPVGSLVAGSRDLVWRAHRVRKMLGGGMRQAGVLAAAGLYALEHHRERLSEDHANARLLGEALARVPGLAVDLTRVETNIVMVDITAAVTAQALADRARPRGVLFGPLSPSRFRLVTHLDVTRADCARAAEILASVMPP
jgi:threonine aldolase